MAVSHGNSALKRRLERAVERMPVLPEVVQRLMALDSQSSDYFEEVKKAIEEEPAYAARILSAANSAASAPKYPITTLPLAITRLGPRGAVNRILAIGALAVLKPKNPFMTAAWRHAIAVATFARNLAAQLRNNELVPDEVYAAGLLHDVGRLVILEEAPEEFLLVETHGDESTPDYPQREKLVFGVTHAELGHLACSRLRLPDAVATVVREHHHHGYAQKFPRLVEMILFCDALMLRALTGLEADSSQESEEVLAAVLSKGRPSFLTISAQSVSELITLSVAEAEILSEELGLVAPKIFDSATEP